VFDKNLLAFHNKYDIMILLVKLIKNYFINMFNFNNPFKKTGRVSKPETNEKSLSIIDDSSFTETALDDIKKKFSLILIPALMLLATEKGISQNKDQIKLQEVEEYLKEITDEKNNAVNTYRLVSNDIANKLNKEEREKFQSSIEKILEGISILTLETSEQKNFTKIEEINEVAKEIVNPQGELREEFNLVAPMINRIPVASTIPLSVRRHVPLNIKSPDMALRYYFTNAPEDIAKLYTMFHETKEVHTELVKKNQEQDNLSAEK